MRFAGGLSAVLLGTAIVIVQPVATALTPSEVSEIAKQITVSIDGANTGSGVIIEHQGNVYNVVTCWHVVRLKGSYTVQTPDGKKYTFNNSQVKRFPGVDLAVFQFTSNVNYRVAEKGNSDQVALGTNISVAGYPQGTSDIDFRRGAISRLVTNPKDGYAFVYDIGGFPGMSGGAILDEQGKLVGIHGRATTRPDTNATTVYGIPLKTYLNIASANLPPAVATPTLPPDIPGNSRLSNAQAYLDRAAERFFKQDKQGAIEDIQQAQKLDPNAAEKTGLKLAQEAAQLAQFQQVELALPKAQLASYLAPNNDKVWLLLGGLQLETKKFDGAIASLKKAQSINPKNANILFALGSAYFQQQKYQEAAVNYQQGLKLKPNDPEGLFDLGNVYFLLGRLPDAIAYYQKAIAQDTKFWPPINNIGLIKYEQGDIKGAIQQWQNAVALDKKAAEPLLALAVGLYNQGDRQQALTIGKQALSIDQRYGNIQFLKQNLWGDRLLADTKKFLQSANKPPTQSVSVFSPDITNNISNTNSQTIASALASRNASFSTLNKALQAAGLTEILQRQGSFTIFAPTDAAFAKLPQDALRELLKSENKDVLVKILTYHIVPVKLLSSDFKSGEIKSFEGGVINVKVDRATGVTVNDAHVTQQDITGSNGVIHAIDQVILPPDL